MTRQHDDSLTSVSLVLRVSHSPTDQVAWTKFVDRYGPKILAWARGWGLQRADAEDVAQAVLVKLARQMGQFRYDSSRSFRGWLKTLTRNAWLDWASSQDKRAESGGEVDAKLACVEAREDLIRRLADTFELELLIEATNRVRGRVADRTWDAYRLTVLEDRPTREVAEKVGMTLAGVFKAKSNILKLIRAEVQALEAEPSIRSTNNPTP